MTATITGMNTFNTENNVRVLQVHSALFTTQASQTLGTTDLVIGGITTAFTSIGTNSKYLIYARWFGEISSAWDTCWNIRVNGTRVGSAGTGAGKAMTLPGQTYIDTNDDSTPENLTVMHLHNSSIAASTSITIDLTAIVYTGTVTVWTNRCFAAPAADRETGTSELIIQEIAA